MKHTLLIITALLFITSSVIPQSKMNINNLVEYGDKKYAPNDDEPYTGKVFDFYENGQKKLNGNYRKGLMNGKWTYYHENGQFHAQGRFIDGDGSNPSESSGIPFNGRTGRWTSWHENGQKEAEGTYKGGKRDGKWTSWFENGQKESEGTYKDGIEDGKWTYYTEVGDGRYSVTYKAGTYNMAVFTDGLGNDYTGTLIGKRMDKDGTYLYQDDEYHQSAEFDDLQDNEYDFSKSPMIYITVKDWEEDGLYIFWHENGQKWMEITYKDGKHDGLWTEWYKNGQKTWEGTWKDGEKDGFWTEWYENGQKDEEGTFKAGQKDGLWTFWYENGQKIQEETYKDGNMILDIPQPEGPVPEGKVWSREHGHWHDIVN